MIRLHEIFHVIDKGEKGFVEIDDFDKFTAEVAAVLAKPSH